MVLSHPDLTPLTKRIIGGAIEVHRELGPGLLESIYEECLLIELIDLGLSVTRQQQIPVAYKGRPLAATFRADLLIENSIIVEVKAVEKLAPVHRAQLQTYMKLTDIRVGFLFNFNTERLPDGIKRVCL